MEPAARSHRIRNRIDERNTSQYLTFALAGEEYGVDILRVQEVKGWTPVTRIPRLPVFVSGVLNLRGSIVPIVDMRARFELEKIDYGPTTVIIVINIQNEGITRPVGIVVDAVSDVIDVEAGDIKAPPSFGTNLDAEFLRGLASVRDKMVLLLDADRLFSEQELEGMPQDA